MEPRLRLSGLEPMEYVPNSEAPRTTFLNIGERCNVAGSMLYKKVKTPRSSGPLRATG